MLAESSTVNPHPHIPSSSSSGPISAKVASPLIIVIVTLTSATVLIFILRVRQMHAEDTRQAMLAVWEAQAEAELEAQRPKLYDLDVVPGGSDHLENLSPLSVDAGLLSKPPADSQEPCSSRTLQLNVVISMPSLRATTVPVCCLGTMVTSQCSLDKAASLVETEP